MVRNDVSCQHQAFEQVTNVAMTEEPYTYEEAAVAKKYNPNKKLRWLIPVALAAQVAFKVCPLASSYSDKLFLRGTLCGRGRHLQFSWRSAYGSPCYAGVCESLV